MLQNFQNLLGNTFYKVEDRNIMFTKLVNKIQEPLNSQLNEITHLKRENQSLKNENSKMLQKDLQNQKLIQNLELKQIKDKQIIEKLLKRLLITINLFNQSPLGDWL